MNELQTVLNFVQKHEIKGKNSFKIITAKTLFAYYCSQKVY